MDNKILWVSEYPVDYDAIRRQFPLFDKKFESFTKEPGILKRKDDGVFRMPAKAGTIRVYRARLAVVLDHESAPWPLVSWLAKNDMITSCSDDDNYGYDDPKYIPVFVHWHGNLYFVANLELVEE